jgi:hypothetical protein
MLWLAIAAAWLAAFVNTARGSLRGDLFLQPMPSRNCT